MSIVNGKAAAVAAGAPDAEQVHTQCAHIIPEYLNQNLGVDGLESGSQMVGPCLFGRFMSLTTLVSGSMERHGVDHHSALLGHHV